jgi:hypothetical protein
MNKWMLVIAGILLVVLLAAGAFTAVQLIGAQAQEDDLPSGVQVFENVFDDGSGSPVTVRTIIDPAPELPDRGADAAGIFLRQEDNSYFVGTGSITLDVEVVNGERSVAAEHSGPEVEVVVGHDTIFYEDVTKVEFEAGESKEQRLQQQVRLAERPEEMPEATDISAWGERRGDRVIAEIVVFSEVE